MFCVCVCVGGGGGVEGGVHSVYNGLRGMNNEYTFMGGNSIKLLLPSSELKRENLLPRIAHSFILV